MNDFGARVAARFDDAAGTYDAHSAAQRHAAQRLAERLLPLNLPPRPRVLEIGCGTGHLTALLALHLPGASILATDVAPAMVAACRERLGANPHLRFAVMDAHRPHVDGGSGAAHRPAGADFCGCRPARPYGFDLICGNLVAQWFDDLPAVCARLAALLAPGGALLLSLPGHETFREWKDAHARLGLVAGTLPLPTPAACRAALPAGGAARVDTERWIDRPADGMSFLRSLRAIGADASQRAPLSSVQLRRVLRELGPAPAVSYEFIYALWRAGLPGPAAPPGACGG